MVTLGSPQFSISSLKSGTPLSDLVHRAGHDIGNPLTSLISLASLVERSHRPGELKLEPDSVEKYSGTIISDAWRVQGIVEKIVLILSDRGANSTPVEVAAVIQTCSKKVLRKAAFRECDVLFAPPAASPRAMIDPAQLEWLISELLLNALTHLSSNDSANGDGVPSAHISLSSGDNGTILLAVENELHGALTMELNTLFEPFIRFPVQSKGAGLGLTAAWAVVEKAGGKISVEAKDGRFRTAVELPAI